MRSSVRPLSFGAVLAAHALLLAAWWAAVRAPEALPPGPVLRLRLLPSEEPGRPAAPVPAAALPRPAPAPSLSAPAAPIAPADPAMRPITAAPAAAPPTETAAPALRLILPPAAATSSPSLRDQMLRDPRANSRPARAATEGLQALGERGPAVAEETMTGEGRRRVRIGRDCVEVRESRMALLDPHNRSAIPMPSQIETCN